MVVPLTEEMEYVTLSYVWGPQPLASSTPSAEKIDEIIQGVYPKNFHNISKTAWNSSKV
jgi:hypothetical protein